jgi:hypothetical protein
MIQPARAALAELGLSTVVGFECSRRPVSTTAVESLKAALEQAGVIFIDDDRGEGVVKLRKAPTTAS